MALPLSNVMRKSKSFVPIEIGEKYLNIAHIIVQKDGQKLAGAFSGDISGASQDDIAADQRFRKERARKEPRDHKRHTVELRYIEEHRDTIHR